MSITLDLTVTLICLQLFIVCSVLIDFVCYICYILHYQSLITLKVIIILIII